MGRAGCLVVAIGFVVILIIAVIIGTIRSDRSPEATDAPSATTWLEGDTSPGSRTRTPWSEEPRTLVAHSGAVRWLSVAETSESLPMESPDPGPNGE